MKWFIQPPILSGPWRASRQPFLPKEPLPLFTEEGAGSVARAMPGLSNIAGSVPKTHLSLRKSHR